MSKNVVLIGMPGCGKSTLSKIIAEKLNRSVIDMDSYIEVNENKSIKELFAISEEHFRDMETKYSIMLGKLDSYIIATGGGIVKRKENIDNIRKNSIIIFINRPIENIIKDIEINIRPLLANGVDTIYKLYNERIDLYKKYCDIEVINDREIEYVANIIIKSIKKWEINNITEEIV